MYLKYTHQEELGNMREETKEKDTQEKAIRSIESKKRK
jgi:hypothetical protein